MLTDCIEHFGSTLHTPMISKFDPEIYWTIEKGPSYVSYVVEKRCRWIWISGFEIDVTRNLLKCYHIFHIKQIGFPISNLKIP